jgi:hypothetical protein
VSEHVTASCTPGPTTVWLVMAEYDSGLTVDTVWQYRYLADAVVEELREVPYIHNAYAVQRAVWRPTPRLDTARAVW